MTEFSKLTCKHRRDYQCSQFRWFARSIHSVDDPNTSNPETPQPFKFPMQAFDGFWIRVLKWRDGREKIKRDRNLFLSFTVAFGEKLASLS